MVISCDQRSSQARSLWGYFRNRRRQRMNSRSNCSTEVTVEAFDTSSLFLRPCSVAFVGLPRKSGPGALNPVDNLRRWGYPGQIHLVHPHVQEIAGLRTVGTVSEIHEPVDLAVISTPRDTVPAIVGECGRKGIKALIVTNQGFAEADGEGIELQRQMVAQAHTFGARILGPNTLGVSNAFDRFNTSFMPLEREEVPIGLICQSGIFFVGAAFLVGGMGVGVDIGNGCDLDIADALEWLGNDERIRCIAVHAEELSGGRRFLETAQRVSARTPIVTLKTGRSPAGAKAAASHSGSMAGEDRIADSAIRKPGIIRATETQEMFDLVRGFVRLPPMKGRRVAVVTLSGAGGIVSLDAMHAWGLKPASLSHATLQGVQELSPPWMPISNPMDIWPALMKHGMKKVYRIALRDALRDPSVDGVLCLALGLKPAEQAMLGTEDLIQELSETADKPIVAWFYGPDAAETRARLEQKGRALAVGSLERGVRVLSHMARFEERKRTLETQ